MIRRVAVLLLLAGPAAAADRPAKEPAYAGKPVYCRLAFGRERVIVWLALDGDKLYVDHNGNGDLTDDGPPAVAKVNGLGDNAQRNYSVPELRVAGRTHHNLLLMVDALKSSGDKHPQVAALLDKRPNARAYRLALEVEMSGRTGTGRGGRVMQFVDHCDARGVLQFAERPADAPLIHLDGPLTLTVTAPAQLTVGRPADLTVAVGSSGEGPGAFATLLHALVIPKDVYPIVEATLPAKEPGGPPVRQRYELKRRTGGNALHGPVRLDGAAGAGTAKLRLSLDDWAGGNVAPAEVEMPVVAGKEIALEPVSPRLKATLQHPTRRGSLVNIRYSPDGRRLVATSWTEGVVQFWDVATGRREATIETSRGARVSDVFTQLSPDWSTLYAPVEGRASEPFERNGQSMFLWKMSGAVRVWDVASGRPRPPLQNDPPHSPRHIRLSPDGRWLIAHEDFPGESKGGPDGGTSLWDVAARTCRRFPPWVQPGFFAPDGRTLVGTRRQPDAGDAVVLIDLATLTETRSFPTGVRFGRGGAFAMSPDGRTLLGGLTVNTPDYTTWTEHLVAWDVATGRELASFGAEEPKTGLLPVLSGDGRTLAVTNNRGAPGFVVTRARLYLLDAATLALRHTIDRGPDVYLGIPAFRPDGRLVAVVERSRIGDDARDPAPEDYPQPKVLLVDAATGDVRTTLVLPQCFCNSVAFSPDGKTLAASGLGQVLLFDVGDL